MKFLKRVFLFLIIAPSKSFVAQVPKQQEVDIPIVLSSQNIESLAEDLRPWGSLVDEAKKINANLYLFKTEYSVDGVEREGGVCWMLSKEPIKDFLVCITCDEQSEKLVQNKLALQKAKKYFELGEKNRIAKRYEEAIKYYNPALKIQEAILGLEHVNRDSLFMKVYCTREFEQICKQTLEDMATTYNNLGEAYSSQNRYKNVANFLHKTTLAIYCKKPLAERHQYIATSYYYFGPLTGGNQDDSEEIIKYLKRACAIRAQVLGFENKDTATAYHNLGLTYDNQGNYEEAIRYYNRALWIQQQVLGVVHRETAQTYDDLGLAYGNQGDYETASQFFAKALKVYEKIYGQEHAQTNAVHNLLNECLQVLGKPKQEKITGVLWNFSGLKDRLISVTTEIFKQAK